MWHWELALMYKVGESVIVSIFFYATPSGIQMCVIRSQVKCNRAPFPCQEFFRTSAPQSRVVASLRTSRICPPYGWLHATAFVAKHHLPELVWRVENTGKYGRRFDICAKKITHGNLRSKFLVPIFLIISGPVCFFGHLLISVYSGQLSWCSSFVLFKKWYRHAASKNIIFH